MTDATRYVIRGGIQGRERLRVLARVMSPTSSLLLDRIGVRSGLNCLDVGCGGGDVTLELARRAAPGGRALGLDIDETKLAIARQEAAEQGIPNIEFRMADVRLLDGPPEFDLAYSRFLLTHLSDPAAAVQAMQQRVRPGGLVAVEDIDFSGNFTYPASPSFQRYHELYCEAVRRRGGDACIGPRLPLLLKEAGLIEVGVSAVQPIGTEGEVKLITPMTMENIAAVVMQEGLATGDEIDAIVRDLYAFAADPGTVSGVPRIVQAWGRRPRSA